ncbi:MAG: septum formation initiator family protein [Verrucomicrobia bacterium]|nr:septum formation initiator family protein [Verrucomicrobiota bacterium]
MNRKSSTPAERIAFGVILVAVVCLCAVLVVPGLRRLHERHEQIEALKEERNAEEQKKLRAEREIGELSTDEGIERVARQELRLVKPGEVVFDFDTAPRSGAASQGDGRP